MKKIMLGATLLLIFSLTLFSCMTTPTENSNDEFLVLEETYPKKTTIDTLTPQPPEWVTGPFFMIKKDKETKTKMMYWNLSREGKNLEMTKRSLDGEAAQIVAEAIKKLVTSQFSKAMEGTVDKSDEFIYSAVAFVSKNVKVTGLMNIGQWWEKYSLQESADSQIEYYYKVFMRYSMPYSEYIKQRDNAWNSIFEEANPEQQKLMNDVHKNLQELDEEAEMMDWGI